MTDELRISAVFHFIIMTGNTRGRIAEDIMNLDTMLSYLPLYHKALLLTLQIGWAGIMIGIALGLVIAFVQYARIPILHRVAAVYIELLRNTPLLVQLFFLYYALPRIGLDLSAEKCGILGLALHGSAYFAEVFRSGLDAVPVIQRESALALGMSGTQVFRKIILPQAVSISVPAFTANVIFLLKETSVFSAISLMDLMFTAKDLIGLYYTTIECQILLVIFYVIMLLPVSLIGSFLERRVRHAGFGD
jgi:polar amino acid transport system permease protein